MKIKKNILEPNPSVDINSPKYEVEIYSSFMNYHGISEGKDHKKWILDYVQLTNKEVAKYAHGKPNEYSPHGIWARFLCRNIKIPQKEKNALDLFLGDLEKKYIQIKKNKEALSLDKRKKYANILHECLAQINNFIDNTSYLIIQRNKKQIDVNKTCAQINVPKVIFSEVISHMENQIHELVLARDKKDEQLVEGYSYFTTTQLQSYIDVHQEILYYYSNQISLSKTSRKPRKLKQKTPEQISSGVKYLEIDTNSGLKSLNPIVIVNCNMVYVFNSKIKAIILYKSKNNETLSFKGSNLLNVDLDNSFGKKIRGYEKYIKNNSFKFPTIKHIDMFFSGLNTKRFIPNTRFNKNTVILNYS